MVFASRVVGVDGEDCGLLVSRVGSRCFFSSEWCSRVEGPRVAALPVGVTERARDCSGSVDGGV